MFEKDQCDNISPTYQKIADLFCPVHISGLLIVCAKAQKKQDENPIIKFTYNWVEIDVQSNHGVEYFGGPAARHWNL